MTRAVVLLSGGMDSAVTAAIAKDHGFDVYALSFDYGQRHSLELPAARRIAAALGVTRHVVQSLDLRAYGGSALTDDIAVPKDRTASEIGADIPPTYVPARNTIFLAHGLAWAEALNAVDIFIGVNALDYSGYPDCRPEFITRFEALANVATKAGVQGRRYRVHAPLMRMTKADIVREGARLDLDLSLTLSCYDPASDGRACGRCDSCRLRLKGFAEAGVPDPARYANAGTGDRASTDPG